MTNTNNTPANHVSCILAIAQGLFVCSPSQIEDIVIDIHERLLRATRAGHDHAALLRAFQEYYACVPDSLLFPYRLGKAWALGQLAALSEDRFEDRFEALSVAVNFLYNEGRIERVDETLDFERTIRVLLSDSYSEIEAYASTL